MIDLSAYNITTIFKSELPWEHVIYDHGPDENFDTIHYNFHCNTCKVAKIKVTFHDFITDDYFKWKQNNNTSLQLLKACANLKTQTFENLECVQSIDGLTPYFSLKNCSNCRQSYIIVIGFGEKQPTRYIAHVQALLSLEKK